MTAQNGILKIHTNKVRIGKTVIAPFLTVMPIDLCGPRGQIEYNK